jgi:hypothetical protein
MCSVEILDAEFPEFLMSVLLFLGFGCYKPVPYLYQTDTISPFKLTTSMS